MERVLDWSQRVIGGALLVWCLLAAASAFRVALARDRDPIARLDEEFRALVFDLPTRGVIGYLEPYEDAGSNAAIRAYYAAQYALAPRVLVGRVGPEFLIVPHGTPRPGGDPRLDGYDLVATSPSQHRVYRRRAP
jgi:hypothetical protein